MKDASKYFFDKSRKLEVEIQTLQQDMKDHFMRKLEHVCEKWNISISKNILNIGLVNKTLIIPGSFMHNDQCIFEYIISSYCFDEDCGELTEIIYNIKTLGESISNMTLRIPDIMSLCDKFIPRV